MTELDCPSAPPHWSNARVIGVVNGTPCTPSMTPVIPAVPVSPEILALAEPVTPREVYRIAATCQKAGCRHWRVGNAGAEGDGRCSLIERALTVCPEVGLQACAIRQTCRWFAQEGRAACQICPGIVTDVGEMPQSADGETGVRFL